MTKKRLSTICEADLIQKYYKDYLHTENLPEIWGDENQKQDIIRNGRNNKRGDEYGSISDRLISF